MVAAAGGSIRLGSTESLGATVVLNEDLEALSRALREEIQGLGATLRTDVAAEMAKDIASLRRATEACAAAARHLESVASATGPSSASASLSLDSGLAAGARPGGPRRPKAMIAAAAPGAGPFNSGSGEEESKKVVLPGELDPRAPSQQGDAVVPLGSNKAGAPADPIVVTDITTSMDLFPLKKSASGPRAPTPSGFELRRSADTAFSDSVPHPSQHLTVHASAQLPAGVPRTLSQSASQNRLNIQPYGSSGQDSEVSMLSNQRLSRVSRQRSSFLEMSNAPAFTSLNTNNIKKKAEVLKNNQGDLYSKRAGKKEIRETVHITFTNRRQTALLSWNSKASIVKGYLSLIWAHFMDSLSWLGDLVKICVLSAAFDTCICAALVLNAAFIGVQADFAARGTEQPGAFLKLETTFAVVFAAELSMRIYTFRMKFFRNGDLWNWFDFVLVALQILDDILSLTVGDTVLGHGSTVRVLRVLKLLRILRLLRVIKLVVDLRKVLYLLIGSLSSFFWTMALLVLLIYILAVFFTQVVADFRISTGGLNWDGDGGTHPAAPLFSYFGSLSESISTLYKAITGGFDWQEVSTPLIGHVDPFVGVMFFIYNSFAVLVMLNLVTGVFVESALKLAGNDKETELTTKAYRIFTDSDSDVPGQITWDDFQDKLSDCRLEEFFEALDVNISHAEDLFKLLDSSGRGQLTVEELVAGSLMLQSPAKAIDVTLLANGMLEVRTTLAEIRDNLMGSSDSARGVGSTGGNASPKRKAVVPTSSAPRKDFGLPGLPGFLVPNGLAAAFSRPSAEKTSSEVYEKRRNVSMFGGDSSEEETGDGKDSGIYNSGEVDQTQPHTVLRAESEWTSEGDF